MIIAICIIVLLVFKDSDSNFKNKDPYLIIEDIISGIPLFLEHIKSNEEKIIFIIMVNIPLMKYMIYHVFL